MKKSIVMMIAAWCWSAAMLGLQAQDHFTASTVPNPKSERNGYVSDPAGILSPDAVRWMDARLRLLEDSTTSQVAVVVLPSIGEADVFDFSQELFNLWGIGQREQDNGMLLLVVKDQRTVRMHTGSGMEAVLTDATTQRIQRRYMVPYFKRDQYDSAVMAGVDQVVRLLTDPAYAGEFVSQGDDTDPSAGEVDLGNGPVMVWTFLALVVFVIELARQKSSRQLSDERLPFWVWSLIYVVVPIVFYNVLGLTWIFAALLYGYLILLAVWRQIRITQLARRLADAKDFAGAWSYLETRYAFPRILAFVMPLPFLFMRNGLDRLQRTIRDTPRTCRVCARTMAKLDESADDQFLADGARLEEKIGSVDHDVWLCAGCQAREIIPYPARKTRYSSCSKCATAAWFMESSRVVVKATKLNEGQQDEHWTCLFCHHTEHRQIVIPRIPESSSDSGGGSSGGGSFGGGSSGGGGSSSSW